MNIKQVVIYGYKLNSHTHSFIHNAFNKTFIHLGYKTIWIDKNDNIDDIDFTNTLFLTTGNVDCYIPIRDDCYYILHNCDMNKYINICKKKIIIIQVFTHDTLKNHEKIIKLNDYIYYYQSKNDNEYSTLYFPWATDLLPYEINENISNLSKFNNTKNEINFIGMITDEWNIVKDFCESNNIIFNSIGGFTKNVDIKQNQELIKNSLIAPSIQTSWQTNNGYIPCRIFKNISYGKMGITNNLTVYELFNNSIIYNSNIKECLIEGLKYEYNNDISYKNAKLIPLMEYVRDNHTYINRINTILYCLQL